MEGVLEKKSELKRKLPATAEGNTPPAAKAPSAPAKESLAETWFPPKWTLRPNPVI